MEVIFQVNFRIQPLSSSMNTNYVEFQFDPST